MGEYEEMSHLPGTDIWYITHQLPKDTRETYQFSIDGQNYIDLLNPRRQLFPLDEDTGIGGWESSVFELPDAPPPTEAGSGEANEIIARRQFQRRIAKVSMALLRAIFATNT